MPGPHTIPEVGVEDAFHLIVQNLRERSQSGRGLKHQYGYDLYLPYVMADYVARRTGLEMISALDRYRSEVEQLSPAFYAAAWELCRRGILRPGISRYFAQVSNDGSGGNGYSVTPWGRKWLEQAGPYDFVPVEPERFAMLLDKFAPTFGPAFKERAHEAI